MKQKYVVNNEALQGFADRIAILVGMDDMADCPCNLVDIYHVAKSKINELEAAEQRYERLAQVAREMLVEYKRLFTSHVVTAGRIKTFTKFTSAGDFLDKLEALGVSVDDVG